MKIEYSKTEDLIPYAMNARTHDDDQINQISASIKEFGFNNPVLIDENGVIIAGHGRVLAATRLNLKEVPVIKLCHLTDMQKKAYVIADNQLALNAGWDYGILKNEIQELNLLEFDVDILGFSDAELSKINENFNFAIAEESEQGRLDEVKKKSCPSCGYEF